MDDWRRARLAFAAISAPPAVWLAVLFIAPLSIIWVLSFGEKSGVIDVNITGTLDNYRRALEPLYLFIFAKSFLMAAMTTVICIAVGFPVALAVAFAPPRLKGLLLLLVILPFWTNLLIRTYALIAVVRTRGVLNGALEWLWDKANALAGWLGLDPAQAATLLGESFRPLELLYNNYAVLLGLVYVHLPFAVLPLYAALDRLDRSYLEASLDLGASQWRTMRSVVVPLALPGIISAVIITFIPALGSFLTPALLGGTDSQMIANVIERQFKSANDWPFGAALSFLLLYLTFFALAVRSLLARRSADPHAGGGL